MGGDRRSSGIEAHAPAILSWVNKTPDIYLPDIYQYEIVAKLKENGFVSSIDAVRNLLIRHGLIRHGVTRKKTLIAREREDIIKARIEWTEGMKTLDPDKLVFIDESGLNTKMSQLRGRSKRGRPCIGSVPHGHWKTFIAALRSRYVAAPVLLEGAMNGEAFACWTEQFLAPTLAPDDIVICDNLNVHKNVRAAIEARGAQLRFLPPYSPDLNPIEMVFAKIKTQNQNHSEECRAEML